MMEEEERALPPFARYGVCSLARELQVRELVSRELLK